MTPASIKSQFVAKSFTLLTYDGGSALYSNELSWEEFVGQYESAGQVLSDLIGDNKYENWYDLIEILSDRFNSEIFQMLKKGTGTDSNNWLIELFNRIISQYGIIARR